MLPRLSNSIIIMLNASNGVTAVVTHILSSKFVKKTWPFDRYSTMPSNISFS